MAQLDNLATRYVEATPERRAGFKGLVAVVQLVLAIGVIIVRRGALLRLAPLERPRP